MADCIKDTGYLAEFSNVDFRQLPTRQKGKLSESLFNFTNRAIELLFKLDIGQVVSKVTSVLTKNYFGPTSLVWVANVDLK